LHFFFFFFNVSVIVVNC